jgi:alanine racemase
LDVARSSANSAAILTQPQSHLDWVRPGYMLYGGSPLVNQDAKAYGLLPAMDFVSAVISLRDIAPGDSVGYGDRWVAERPSRIATIAAGYGDGYPRHAPNGTPVLVAGRRAPLAGRVSMDMLSVDVTDLANIPVGAPALLWGDGLPVDEIARCAGTIGYELLAAMPERVPRELAS